MRSTFIAAILVLAATTSWAEEPPSWVNLGELDGSLVRCIVEIPGTDTILAAGSWYGFYAEVWRTTDRGNSWVTVLSASHADPILDMHRDPASGCIWALSKGWQEYDDSLYCSTDDGLSWRTVPVPLSNPRHRPNDIELVPVDDTIYYIYYGGTISGGYTLCLFGTPQDSIDWKIVQTYPQCDAITYLKYQHPNLLVFARDTSHSHVRVFTHTIEELEVNASVARRVLTKRQR